MDNNNNQHAITRIETFGVEQFDHMFRTEIRGTTPALAAASFPRDDADSPYPGAFCNPT